MALLILIAILIGGLFLMRGLEALADYLENTLGW